MSCVKYTRDILSLAGQRQDQSALRDSLSVCAHPVVQFAVSLRELAVEDRIGLPQRLVSAFEVELRISPKDLHKRSPELVRSRSLQGHDSEWRQLTPA